VSHASGTYTKTVASQKNFSYKLDLTFPETTLTPRGYQPNLFGLAQKKLEGKLSLCLCADPLDEQDRATFTRTMTEYFLSIFFTPGSNPPHIRPSENCYCISCTTTTLLFVTLPNIHRFKKNSLAHSAINLP